MRSEPLFIRVANKNAGALEIIQSFKIASSDESSIKIASEAEKDIPDISIFKKDFKELLEDILDNGVSQRVINYLNSYMKPSLSEIINGTGSSRTGEKRTIFVKDPKAPWVEAIVCYNLSLYIKAYGFGEIKKCPICAKFFTNKGKYAKYCSETCKGQGSSNE